MTGRELIENALRKIGAIGTAETLSSDQLVDGLSTANDLIDSWSVEGLLIYANTREEFAMAASTQLRTMGTGGNFNTSRPVKITNVGVEDSTSENPVEIINVDQWMSIVDKASTATNPTRVYIAGTYPLENLYLWPVPTSTNNLVIYSEKQITALAADTTLSLPPGYQRALVFNLAIELAPEYGKTVGQEIASVAVEAKANIMRKNIKPVLMSSDVLGITASKPFNIYTGE